MKRNIFCITLLLLSYFATAQYVHKPWATMSLGNGTFVAKGLEHGFFVVTDNLGKHEFITIDKFDTIYGYYYNDKEPLFDYFPETDLLICLDDLDGNFNFIDIELNIDGNTSFDTIKYLMEQFQSEKSGLKFFEGHKGLYARPNNDLKYIISSSLKNIADNNLILKKNLANQKLTINKKSEGCEAQLEKTMLTILGITGDLKFIELDRILQDTKNKTIKYHKADIITVLARNSNEVIVIEKLNGKYLIKKKSPLRVNEITLQTVDLLNDKSDVLFSSAALVKNAIVGRDAPYLAFNRNDSLVVLNTSNGKTIFSMANKIPLRFESRDQKIQVKDSKRKLYDVIDVMTGKIIPDSSVDLDFSNTDATTDPETLNQYKMMEKEISKAYHYQLDNKRKLVFLSTSSNIRVVDLSSMKVVASFGDQKYQNIYLAKNNKLIAHIPTTKSIQIWDISPAALNKISVPAE